MRNPNVERIESPDGQRLVIIDHTRDDMWVARRIVHPAEKDDALAMVARWEEKKKPSAPALVPRARTSRKRKPATAPVLSLM